MQGQLLEHGPQAHVVCCVGLGFNVFPKETRAGLRCKLPDLCLRAGGGARAVPLGEVITSYRGRGRGRETHPGPADGSPRLIVFFRIPFPTCCKLIILFKKKLILLFAVLDL